MDLNLFMQGKLNMNNKISAFYELNHVIAAVKGFLDLCSAAENHALLTEDYNRLAAYLSEALEQASLTYKDELLKKT